MQLDEGEEYMPPAGVVAPSTTSAEEHNVSQASVEPGGRVEAESENEG